MLKDKIQRLIEQELREDNDWLDLPHTYIGPGVKSGMLSRCPLCRNSAISELSCSGYGVSPEKYVDKYADKTK